MPRRRFSLASDGVLRMSHAMIAMGPDIIGYLRSSRPRQLVKQMRIPCVAEQNRQQRDDLGLIGISMFISDSMTAIYVVTYST